MPRRFTVTYEMSGAALAGKPCWDMCERGSGLYDHERAYWLQELAQSTNPVEVLSVAVQRHTGMKRQVYRVQVRGDFWWAVAYKESSIPFRFWTWQEAIDFALGSAEGHGR